MKNTKLKNVHGGIFFSDGIHAATERPSSTYQYRYGGRLFHAVTSLDVRLNSQVKMYMVVHFYRASGWNLLGALYLYRLFAKGDLCKYAAHLLRCTPKINAQRTKSTSAFYFRLSPCICIASLQRLTERLFFLNKPGKCIRQCFSYRKIVRLELHLNRVAVKLWRNSLTILRGYTP